MSWQDLVSFELSADNFPDSFGVTGFDDGNPMTDHDTPPVRLTFDGTAETGGCMTVNERAVYWPGKPDGFFIYNEASEVEADFLTDFGSRRQ